MFTNMATVHEPLDGATSMPTDMRPEAERLADPRVRIGVDFGDSS